MSEYDFGTRLRRARTALGWTQDELAAASGTTAPLVSNVELGAVQRLVEAMEAELDRRVATGDELADAALRLLPNVRPKPALSAEVLASRIA